MESSFAFIGRCALGLCLILASLELAQALTLLNVDIPAIAIVLSRSLLLVIACTFIVQAIRFFGKVPNP